MKPEELSLGEGTTPIIKAVRIPFYMMNNIELYFKNEGRNPNGTFFDRAAIRTLRRGLERNKEGVIAYSNGNMASSIAAYSSRAGIKSFIFVSEDEYKYENFLQTLSFDTKVIVIKDKKEKIIEMVEELQRLYPSMAGFTGIESDIKEAISDIVKEIEDEIGAPDYYVVKIDNYFSYRNYFDFLPEGKVIGVTDKEAYAPFDDVIFVDLNEMEEGKNLITKQEGFLANRNLAVGIAGLMKCDRRGLFKDKDKVVYLIDSVDIKTLHLKEVENKVHKIEFNINKVKKIMGLN